MIPTEPIAYWVGKELLEPGKIRSTLTIIFRTVGCYWGRCTMCGFRNNCSNIPVSGDDVYVQFKTAMRDCPPDSIVKIYSSGSFFDTREVAADARRRILSELRDDERILRVVIETLPEFVSEDILSELKEGWELAIGLETSNDRIRRKFINKSFDWSDYRKACELAMKHGIRIRTYLLLKPPFVSEKCAIEDVKKSIMDVSHYSNVISINLCNVQRGTLVERMWRSGDFRPPWLWSIVSILREMRSKVNENVILISDPVAAGSERGPHNCGKCDLKVATAIRKFSLTQDVKDLELKCKCLDTWEMHLELEDFSFGSSFQ